MLNKSERYKILKTWKFLAILGQLPIEVDLTNWRLGVPTIWKQWISALCYSLFGLHALVITCSLVYNCMFAPNLELHQLIVHVVMAYTSVMCTFWYYEVYIEDPGLFAAYVNWTLVGNVGGTPDLEDGLTKPWTGRLREYSRQDLIGLTAPHTLLVGLAIIGAVYVLDPSMTILLYNALPTYLQNRAMFGLLMVEEVRFYVMIACIGAPIFQMHVVTFDLVGIRLLALKQRIETGTVRRGSTYKILRGIQLYLSIFNKVNRYLIFTFKLLGFLGSSLSGFAAIAHFQERPIFGIMYYNIARDNVFFYVFVYEKAFLIPSLFEETASLALLHMTGSRRDKFRKQISSLQPAFITAGRFYALERTSTLIYMDFVVTNIVSLLVAFG